MSPLRSFILYGSFHNFPNSFQISLMGGNKRSIRLPASFRALSLLPSGKVSRQNIWMLLKWLCVTLHTNWVYRNGIKYLQQLYVWMEIVVRKRPLFCLLFRGISILLPSKQDDKSVCRVANVPKLGKSKSLKSYPRGTLTEHTKRSVCQVFQMPSH